MKKTILIPTDFTVQSLNVLKNILTNSAPKSNFDIILLHGLSLSDSIRDLLFFSKSQQLESLVSLEFEEAIEVLNNKFDSQISSLTIDLFTGYNLTSFNNYLEGKKVAQIYISENALKKTNSKSFDLLPFIKKCSVPVLSVDTKTASDTIEREKIADVFINQVSIG